ncbi:MAG: hypothetical protein D6712_01045 [Chloroflexi bacterium]|nr:MAG: hypothetical protein D6712_01045 [Chloroflexota bacterium]
MVDEFQQVGDPIPKQAGAAQDISARMGIVGELFSFLWKRKLYWLIPMIIVLVVLIALIIIAGTGPGGIFIYSLI